MSDKNNGYFYTQCQFNHILRQQHIKRTQYFEFKKSKPIIKLDLPAMVEGEQDQIAVRWLTDMNPSL